MPGACCKRNELSALLLFELFGYLLKCTDNQHKRRPRTWSHVFCALTTTTCTSVPNQQELIALQNCGLGLKEVSFYLHDDAEAAQSKLLRWLRLFDHR